MALTKSKRTWHGRAVKEGGVSINDLWRHLPLFTQSDFYIGEGENKYLDLISRDPLSEFSLGDEADSKDSMRIPVASVSKSYKLVQHRQVLDSVLKALDAADIKPDPKAEVRLSEYGARMWVSFLLQDYGFNPGDGHPLELKVNCLNSMDSRFPIKVYLTWYRPVSQTAIKGPEFKKKHSHSFKESQIVKFLTDELNRLSDEKNQYTQWYETTFGKLCLTNGLI